METKPTYEQAKLDLRIYDLRREPRLRQARDWFFANYRVQSIDDAMRIAPFGTEAGSFVSMVFSYWERVCALLNYGLLHEDLFFETSGEFYGVYDLVKGILPQARQRFVDPHFLEHLEKAGQRFEAWKERRAPGHIAAMRQFMRQTQTEGAKKAA